MNSPLIGGLALKQALTQALAPFLMNRPNPNFFLNSEFVSLRQMPKPRKVELLKAEKFLYFSILQYFLSTASRKISMVLITQKGFISSLKYRCLDRRLTYFEFGDRVCLRQSGE